MVLFTNKQLIDFIFLLLQRTLEKRLSLFMREGHWFVSFYNDFGDVQNVDMIAALSHEMTEVNY